MIDNNILLKPFETPMGVPPFGQFSSEDFEPAIREAIYRKMKEVDRISNNPEPPTFDNTVKALEYASSDLDRVLGVFFPLLSALCTDNLMEISDRMMPLLSESSTRVTLNETLWGRIKTVYDGDERNRLDQQDRRLLDETYDAFRRSGALLQGEDRTRFSSIVSRLSELSNKFGQNVLREMNALSVTVDFESIKGLPDDIVSEAAALAAELGEAGRYVLTLHQPVYTAVMRDSADRDLRERMWRMYMGRNLSGDFDNRGAVCEIVRLRSELARLMGRDTYADYSLEHTMAHTPSAVNSLLDRLLNAYIEPGKKEIDDLQQFASRHSEYPLVGDLRPWDYSFYFNLMRRKLYDYDIQALRPYFQLENVVKGVFGLAERLYGIHFEERHDLPVYHPDVKTFEAIDADGSSLGVLYADFFPRSTKRPGAWMTDFREQAGDERPVVSIVMNFSKPSADKPSLLTPTEVGTLLHEFGHALHSLFSKVRYASMAGTSVYRDFVELPSQFNENFLTEREFLDSFAKHYKTGEPIPSSEIDKIVAARQFGASYACLRQLSFGMLDMKWHSLTPDNACNITEDEVESFEHEAMAPTALFADESGACMSVQFGHIFSGGYAAGYYSYKWAEVLDADAFDAFKEGKSVFNHGLAERFRQIILQNGGTRNPDELYREWRGRDATINALLRRDGIR